jgi:prolyl-tRNA synthetase
MIATHGDDKGPVLPPKVAPIQVVIVPIMNEQNRAQVLEVAAKMRAELAQAFSVKLDDRDYITPGRKFNEWELRGIPLRIEVGPRDISQNQAVLARRDSSTKRTVSLAELRTEVGRELDDVQRSLFVKAEEMLKSNVRQAATYDELKTIIASMGGVVRAPWCGSAACEDKVKQETGAKIINVPLEQGEATGACVSCGAAAKMTANFARSY